MKKLNIFEWGMEGLLGFYYDYGIIVFVEEGYFLLVF